MIHPPDLDLAGECQFLFALKAQFPHPKNGPLRLLVTLNHHTWGEKDTLQVFSVNSKGVLGFKKIPGVDFFFKHLLA